MAKSRRGKTKRFAINMQKRLIDSKFKECPKGKEKELFLMLENWAKSDLTEEQSEIFLTALYGANATQEIQMEIAIDRALEKMKGNL